MKSFHLSAPYFLVLTAFAYASLDPSNVLQKRQESGTTACYPTDILDFSALCPHTNYQIQDGLNVIEILYYAMKRTTVPDDTIYQAQENIVCMTHGPGQNVTFTLSAQAGDGILSAGASVSFSLTLTGNDNGGICLFSEGIPDKATADNVTLAQARDHVFKMITTPNLGCKTCGRIPIRANGTDGTDNGGILKIDFRSDDNCIGKCIGPNSFNTTASATATGSAAASTSKGSAAKQLDVPRLLEGVWILAIMTTSALLGYLSM
ncbi:MAG: hypothetical protein M1839_006110 [Geoglossum umbratile]|nr:MAG: hypothetical protein M1839_006110 [Geoglossum umbratile]